MRRILVLMLVLLSASNVRAAPVTVALTPETAAIGFRAWAFGLIPYDGVFTRFKGALTVDPTAPGQCRVEIEVEIASLRMPTAQSQEAALAPGMLDPTRFPVMSYAGNCQAGRDAVSGRLTLHGVTGGLELEVTRQGRQVSAEATLHRAAWDMHARGFTVGPSVRIRIGTTLPP